MRDDDLGRWLKTVQAGKPACVFADDVADARNAFEQLLTSELEPARPGRHDVERSTDAIVVEQYVEGQA